MIKYVYSSFTDAYLLLILLWRDYKNAFINVQGSNLEHIRERLAGFIVWEVISQKEEFYFLS
jgi:hypothetical protein